MKPKIETCDFCGREFKVTYAFCYICEDCRREQRKYTTSPDDGYSLYAREQKIKANAIERAKKNERIIGAGYAERQIAESLILAGKVKTEL